MVPLTGVDNEFEARVLVAKLGSAGILAEVRGVSIAYPTLGTAEVWVEEEELHDARELITADLDDAFPASPGQSFADSHRWLRAALVAVSILLLGSFAFGGRCSPDPPAVHTR
jgi:hypothetical protein